MLFCLGARVLGSEKKKKKVISNISLPIQGRIEHKGPETITGGEDGSRWNTTFTTSNKAATYVLYKCGNNHCPMSWFCAQVYRSEGGLGDLPRPCQLQRETWVLGNLVHMLLLLRCTVRLGRCMQKPTTGPQALQPAVGKRRPKQAQGSHFFGSSWCILKDHMLERKNFYEDINKGTDCYFHTSGSVQILSRKVIEQNILFLFSIKIHRHTQKRQEEWIWNVPAAPGQRILREHSYLFLLN